MIKQPSVSLPPRSPRGRALFGRVVLGVVLVGCHCEKHVDTPPPAAQVDCSYYEPLTAALAARTVECQGTIGPNSFKVEGGLLQPTFGGCVADVTALQAATAAPAQPAAAGSASTAVAGAAPAAAQEDPRWLNVKNVLALQSFGGSLPRFRECLTDRWSRWSEFFAQRQIGTCPHWKRVEVIGQPSKAGSQQLSKLRPRFPYIPSGLKPGEMLRVGPDAPAQRMPAPLDPAVKPSADERFADIQLPVETNVIYDVGFRDGEDASKCLDPAMCAAQCAAGLPGFVLAASGTRVSTDPIYWTAPDFYNPACPNNSTDPWCPVDYVHPMSRHNFPPGDIYGDPNRARAGEHCTRWNSANNAHYEVDLQLECDSTNICLARCGPL